ncbi:MAG: DUF3540 domain-containing protein [Polyangiaceae bacterium]|nr:DUF3540 domain-containing protein [Polyangiaceae bacterium]
MGQPAVKRQNQVLEETAVVVYAEPGKVEVESDGHRYFAKRAVSCLVAPEKGDRVLLAIESSGDAYVLAVLERENGAATVSVEGDLDLRSEHGEVRVTGPEGVSVISPKNIALVSEDLTVRSVTARVVVDGLNVLGKQVNAQLERAKIAAVSVDSTMDRLYQRAKRIYRIASEGEHVRAESVDIQGSKSVSVRSENTSIVAEDLVKVDGGQIQLG